MSANISYAGSWAVMIGIKSIKAYYSFIAYEGLKLLIVFKGIVMCFILLLVCVVGMANGPAEMIFFYEKEVQEKAIELGLTTAERMKKRKVIAAIVIFFPFFLLVPYIVYGINGVSDFKTAAIQMTIIYLIAGLFDRIFIDWYWVEKTKAWIIPGTEDMRPYIYGKTLIGKWTSTLVGFPILAL